MPNGIGIILGMFVGAVGTMCLYLGVSISYMNQLHVPRMTAIAMRAQALTRFGSVRTIIVRTTPTITLPPIPRVTPLKWIAGRPLTVKLRQRFVAKMAIIEDRDTFNRWWSEKAENDRRREYVGRRRHSGDTCEWRAHWAKHPTQWWPTLATSGDAVDIITNIVPDGYFDVARYDVPVG